MVRRLLILGLVAVAVFTQIRIAAAQSNSPPFPRLGAALIGGAVNPANVANIGKIQVLVISGYEGFGNLSQNVANAKAAYPNMKVGGYIIIANQLPNASGFATQLAAVNSNNWWARASDPSGAFEYLGNPNQAINIIQNRLSGSSNPPAGVNIRQWMANWVKTQPGVFASNEDAVFIDNFGPTPSTDSGSGDWLETGTAQSNTDATVQQDWRNAYADFVSRLRTTLGSQYMVWGNTAAWYGGYSINGYSGVLNGGLFENSVASDIHSSWAFMMAAYAEQMNAMAPFNGGGPYLIFEGSELGEFALTDYQNLRYTLGSCLLDNGYYYWDTGGQSIPWFDEFNQNLGSAIAGPNNPTNGTYSNGGLTVWKQGVWRRDFQNGIALVNPKGNGVQTVTLETTYRHFSGTQAPSVNNGQSVTSVTLNDRDGVILLRTTTAQQQPVPDAPQLTVQ